GHLAVHQQAQHTRDVGLLLEQQVVAVEVGGQQHAEPGHMENGTGAAQTEPSSSSMLACSSCRAQPRLRPVSSTPLGTPVVPEVYRMSAVSSGAACSPGSWGWA